MEAMSNLCIERSLRFKCGRGKVGALLFVLSVESKAVSSDACRLSVCAKLHTLGKSGQQTAGGVEGENFVNS
jgi:hypothetical protein